MNNNTILSQEQSAILQQKQKILDRQVAEAMGSCFMESVDSAFDLQHRIKKDFNIDLATNQMDLVEAIVDLKMKDIAETDARSGGKTYGAAIGLSLLSLSGPIQIGITAPTDGQANRVITSFVNLIAPRSDYIMKQINWRSTTSTRVVWKTGSVWEAFSGNEFSSGESRHYDVMLMDESQDMSDFAVSNMILPMLQASKIGKVIKIGVPRNKNHFFRSAHATDGIYLCHDWLHCPNLHNAGTFEFQGVKYPELVLARMPYPKWQQYFPNNPELWRDVANPLTVEDFETQEEMKWLVDASTYLDEEEQAMLLGDFTFDHLETEEYYFGLDIAGGKFIKKGKKNDMTSLSIGRIKNGVKQKIAGFRWQGDAIDQFDEILSIIHPKYGRFKCVYGTADYGYNPMMIDALVKNGVDLEPIMFGGRDPNTGKNNKNAMFEVWKYELQCDRWKYPHKDFIQKDKNLKEGFTQWCVLEKRDSRGINSIIEAPSGMHDDIPCSDILLNRAMMTDPQKRFSTKSKKGTHKFPSVITGVSTSVGIDKVLNGQTEEQSDLYNVGNLSGNKKKDQNPFGGGPRSL